MSSVLMIFSSSISTFTRFRIGLFGPATHTPSLHPSITNPLYPPNHLRLFPNMRFWQAISILLASFTIANAANVPVRQRDSSQLLGKRQVVQANICATVGPLSIPGLTIPAVVVAGVVVTPAVTIASVPIVDVSQVTFSFPLLSD